jgi:thiopurine S-methyltransferase
VQPSFWHERWRLGQIGFHQAVVEQQLAQHWSKLQLAEGDVFVPLCGKSLDLLWLRDQGLRVSGVELSAVALESLCLEQGILARRLLDVRFEKFEADGLRLLRGDFFDISRELLGDARAVYDRASLIAFTPDARARYVEHMSALTRPGTKTLLITVEYAQQQMNGPPFSVSTADVEHLYGSNHTIRLLDRLDILANEARLRSKGVTELHQNCFLLTRQ